MLPDGIDSILLARYFNGDASEADVQVVRRWMAEEPARVLLADRLREVWRIGGEAQPGWDVEQALAAVQARAVASLEGASVAAPKTPARSLQLLQPVSSRWRRLVFPMAAAVVLAIGLGLVWQARRLDTPRALAAMATRTFTTANAERAMVTLSDGTRVTLSPGSKLRVPQQFSDRARQVALEGEAYFEVMRDPARPFTVASGNGVTQVLGTKFGMRARVEEGIVTVVVSEGRVSFALLDTAGVGEGDAVVLSAGDLGRLPLDGTLAVERGVDVPRYLGWTEGRLTFVDAPVPVVLAELARWYDLEFRLGDQDLAERHLSTSFRHETIPQILDVLRSALDVRVTQDGRVVTLYPSH